MRPPVRQRFRLSNGAELSFFTGGDPAAPAVVLLHGTPQASGMFEGAAAVLSQSAYVVAPDLPGFGASDALPDATFPALGQAVGELLDHLGIGPRYIYLHDWGAPVGLHLAMQAPERVLGLIIQNANAHETGHGPGWAATKAYWTAPNAENEAASTAHLTFEGTRDQYISGVPSEIAERIPPEHWEEDWRVMQRPGHMETQRSLIKDYGNYVASYADIARYLADWQPPALMVWGRHDIYFAIDETLSWMKALPRMDAHIFDAGHLLLETHTAEAAPLMLDFVRRTEKQREKAEKANPRAHAAE